MKCTIRTLFIYLFFLLYAGITTAFSLEYEDIYSGITDVFANLVSGNEGRTGFRSLNIPSGGRAEAMGTAYTGLADDISFFEYNPAASAVIMNTEFALFHNAWIADSALETIAFTTRKEYMGTGAYLKCFYIPFTEYNMFGERVSNGYYTETSLSANLSYNFFAGYDFKGIAAGVNVKTAYRGMPDYADNLTNQVGGGSGVSQSALAFMGDIGLLFQFNVAKSYASRDANLRVGLAIVNLGAAITGFGREITLDDPLPSRVQAGVSYRVIRPVLLSTEFRLPFELDGDSDIIASFGSMSAALGCEVTVTKFFAVQTGFLVQGSNPRMSLGGQFIISTLQLNVNYTLDMASSFSTFNRISVSLKMNMGDHGRGSTQSQIDRCYTEGIRAYSAGNFEEAIQLWDECLILDKRFDPAINAKRIAENALYLRQQILELQRLD